MSSPSGMPGGQQAGQDGVCPWCRRAPKTERERKACQAGVRTMLSAQPMMNSSARELDDEEGEEQADE